jgi:hypothetical protein
VPYAVLLLPTQEAAAAAVAQLERMLAAAGLKLALLPPLPAGLQARAVQLRTATDYGGEGADPHGAWAQYCELRQEMRQLEGAHVLVAQPQHLMAHQDVALLLLRDAGVLVDDLCRQADTAACGWLGLRSLRWVVADSPPLFTPAAGGATHGGHSSDGGGGAGRSSSTTNADDSPTQQQQQQQRQRTFDGLQHGLRMHEDFYSIVMDVCSRLCGLSDSCARHDLRLVWLTEVGAVAGQRAPVLASTAGWAWPQPAVLLTCHKATSQPTRPPACLHAAACMQDLFTTISQHRRDRSGTQQTRSACGHC